MSFSQTSSNISRKLLSIGCDGCILNTKQIDRLRKCERYYFCNASLNAVTFINIRFFPTRIEGYSLPLDLRTEMA